LVFINGLPGVQRALQFEGLPGPRLINVSATTNEGYVDGGTWELEVIDCGPEQPFARLWVGINPYHPYTVDFLVANAAEIAPDGTQYDWDFGDGSTESTMVPFISHSYEGALLPDQEHLSFQASVTLQLPDGTSLGTPTTVSVWNDYAASRNRGLIRPLLANQPELTLSGNQLTGEYSLRNLEDEPILFTERQVQFQPCDPAIDLDPAPWEIISIAIGPGELLIDSLVLDAATVPEYACGVGLHLAGQSGSAYQAVADIYFQIKRDPLSYHLVNDQVILDTLAYVVEQGLVDDPDQISDEELYQLSQAGLIPQDDGAVIDLAKAVDRVVVPPGEALTYTITLSLADDANGPQPGVIISDTIPAGMSYYAHDFSSGNAVYDAPNNRLEWVGDLTPGQIVTISLSVQVNDDAVGGSIITNTVAAPDWDERASVIIIVEPSNCDTKPAQLGCPCNRGDLPQGFPSNVGNVSCQATNQFAVYPPHLPNALKGDVILVGGCGFVGEMLNKIKQSYVHTGIMTQNYTEIARSTSTDERPSNDDYLNEFPTPYIDPSVLRYGWPGIIRSDIGTAFSQVNLRDPAGDKYTLKDFYAWPAGCTGNIVPPLVVKPPPAQGQQVRPLLRAAADIARGLATPVDEWAANGYEGTGNYRFYAYTDASIADSASYDHPTGEPATVCSTFVWHMLTEAIRAAGREGENLLEGPTIEPAESALGWERGSSDGLYHYP
jgi:uncharacterized repeat protein (TIGR01451 family)